MHLKAGPSVLTVDGIAADPHGHVFVGDAAGDRVEELGPDGRLVRTLDGRAAVHGGFDFVKPGESTADAQDIASVGLDRRGDLYVADTGHYLIEKFDPSGRFLRSWGGNGFKPGQFGEGRLVGVALDGTAHVFATNAGAGRIEEFSPSGRLVASYVGSGKAAFKDPTAVAVDSSGAIYVYDQDRSLLLKLNRPA